MKQQLKKAASLLGALCLFNGMITGCSPAADSSDSSVNQMSELLLTDDSGQADAPETETVQNTTGTADSENLPAPETAATSGGNQDVLPPDVAAVVDADLVGEVWKIKEDSFYIAEEYIEILDDGSILSQSPSTETDIPDSELVLVVFDENTHFYMRTIYDGGESYKDTEASFQDIVKHLSVEMKGQFENNVFHADEIRIVKVA